MSRSGYSDDCDDPLQLGRWRAAVRSALYGKRGQAFLREALAALDAMPDKRLISEHLVIDGKQAAYGDPDLIVGGDELAHRTGTAAPMGGMCLLGAVGTARAMDDLTQIDPHDSETVADRFGIAHAMACEIVYVNDEGGSYRETPEDRYARVRKWVAAQIKQPTDQPRG